MASDMNLLDDFAEIEKLEMESGDRKPKAPPASSSPKEEDRRSVTLEKSGDELVTTGSIPNGHPEKVHDIWNLVVHKHEASGESVDTIFEKIRHALDLDRIDVHAKREDSDVSYDLSEIEKMVRDLVQKITHMIGTSAEDNGVRSRPLLHGKYELCGRLEYLVQVCHDLLHGKANLEKFIDEVCLTLKYMVSQYLSNQDLYDTVDSATKNCDGDKSLGTVNTQSPQEFQSAKPGEAVSIQKEVQEGPVQSTEDQSMVNHQERFDKELTGVIIAQDDNIVPGRKSTYCEIESPAAEASVEVWAAQGENQSPAELNPQNPHSLQNSDILAAADKLAECQETITILSKQLQALKIPTSGPLDSPLCNPQSLASILAEEFANAVGSNSPATPKQVQFKKEEDDELYATPKRSPGQTQNADGDDRESMQIVVHPMFAELRQDDGSADPGKKKKKRGPSLLGRIMFRKKVEGGS
uniref:Uncharacterized protein n=1 Tax=Arundo donax TaxID=35708 RepID=A0A0A9H6Z8_ARUDO